MTDVNPYASPVERDTAAIERSRVRGVAAFVVMSFVLDALIVFGYGAATAWLLFSRSMRRQAEIAGGSDG